MSKFKVGDNIVRINDAVYGERAGFKAIVDANYCYESPNSVRFKIFDENWELSKPKWTIYNNTLPWSDLSDKQKGKLLLANHSGIRIEGVGFLSIAIPVKFECNIIAYFAVKPELTMEEIFESDWYDCSQITGDCARQMLVKGWVKK
jgi:hypothetical protein